MIKENKTPATLVPYSIPTDYKIKTSLQLRREVFI